MPCVVGEPGTAANAGVKCEWADRKMNSHVTLLFSRARPTHSGSSPSRPACTLSVNHHLLDRHAGARGHALPLFSLFSPRMPTTNPPPPQPSKQTATDLKSDGCSSFYAASLACLDRAGYDKEVCVDAFEAYKACRATEVSDGWRENSQPCCPLFFFLSHFTRSLSLSLSVRRQAPGPHRCAAQALGRCWPGWWEE